MSQLPARPIRQVDRLEWMPFTNVLTLADLTEGKFIYSRSHFTGLIAVNNSPIAKIARESVVTADSIILALTKLSLEP